MEGTRQQAHENLRVAAEVLKARQSVNRSEVEG
jgi:hypothetical protein